MSSIYRRIKIGGYHFAVDNMSISGQILLENLIFSDECHIYLKGMPNRQNYRNLSATKPNYFFERSLHSPKITVGVG